MHPPPPRPLSGFFLAGSAVFVVVAIGMILMDPRRLVPWLLFLVSLSNFMTAFLMRRQRRSAPADPADTGPEAPPARNDR